MQNPEPEKIFFSIPTDKLLDNTQASFDVYVLVEKATAEAKLEDYVVYAKAPYRWTLRELGALLQSGIKELYIEEANRGNYQRYIALQQQKVQVNTSIEAKFRIKNIQDVAAHLIEACFLSEISTELTSSLKETASSMVECICEDPLCVLHISNLCNNSIYTYIHSTGVAALATSIALKLGETNKEILTQYALAGLLHDLGKKDIPAAILNKAGPLTQEEWDIMKSHPQKGVEILKPLDVSPMVLDVVGLHHEKLDGSGYAAGIEGRNLPDWVKIITVADIFSALTTSRCYHFKRSRFEALMFMKHELRGKISTDVFEALVASLVVSEKKE